MSIFEDTKERLNIKTAAEYYGIKANHSGMCICPFHSENTPSMKLYDNNFYCFGCGEHGDVIVLAEKLFQLSPVEAVNKLNTDFRLGIDIIGRTAAKGTNEHYLKMIEKHRFKEWEEYAWNVIIEYRRILKRWLNLYKPWRPNDKPDRRHTESLCWYEYTNYLCSVFINGDDEEKKSLKETIEHIEQKLIKEKSQKGNDNLWKVQKRNFTM